MFELRMKEEYGDSKLDNKTLEEQPETLLTQVC